MNLETLEYYKWKLKSFNKPLNIYVLIFSIMHSLFVVRDFMAVRPDTILAILFILGVRFFPLIISILTINLYKYKGQNKTVLFYHLYNTAIISSVICTFLSRAYFIPASPWANLYFDSIIVVISTLFIAPLFSVVNILLISLILVIICLSSSLGQSFLDSFQPTIVPLLVGLISVIYLLEEQFKKVYQERKYLKELALYDQLTQVWNRNYLKTNVIDENDNFILSGTLAIIDFDNFKELNNKEGHNVGDDQLIKLSKIIKAYSRKDDIIMRFSGEEFLIIYKDANPKNVFQKFENIRVEVEHNLKCTVSIGISTFEQSNPFKETIKVAYNKLNSAKKDGKNKIVY